MTETPFTFTLNLQKKDLEKLFYITYGNGTTPEELFASFVSDLTDGETSNGSDERLKAQDYFERLDFNRYLEPDFLAYCVKDFLTEELYYALEDHDNGETEALSSLIGEYEEKYAGRHVKEQDLEQAREFFKNCAAYDLDINNI